MRHKRDVGKEDVERERFFDKRKTAKGQPRFKLTYRIPSQVNDWFLLAMNSIMLSLYFAGPLPDSTSAFVRAPQSAACASSLHLDSFAIPDILVVVSRIEWIVGR